MAVEDWSTTASSNASVGGVSIAEGMARAGVNNAIRGMMAELKTYFQSGMGVVNVKEIGALGDWNGAAGTDNLAAFNAAVAALPTGGGVIVFPVDPAGNNDYRISDSWNIRKSNVTVVIPRGVTVRTTAATTYGHTIAFVDGAAYGGSDSTQITNVEISGGGKVIATGSSGADNAIGFTRCDNYRCIGMAVYSDRKGITAQLHCTNGVINYNHVEYAGNAGIAVEGDAAGTYQTRGAIVCGNRIEQAVAQGINFTYAAGSDLEDVVCKDNIVEASTSHGFAFSHVAGLDESGNVVLDSGARAFSYTSCSKQRTVTPRSEESTNQGIALISPGADVQIIAPALRNTSAAGSGVSAAIYVESPSADITIISPKVSGSNHNYAIDTSSMSSYVVRVIDSSGLAAGTSGTFDLLSAFDIINRTDGGRKQQSIAYAATITPDYLSGSSILVGTLTGAIQINAPTNAKAGQSVQIRLVQNGAGTFATTFGSGIVFTGSLTTTGNTVSLIQLDYDGTTWRGWILYTGQALS